MSATVSTAPDAGSANAPAALRLVLFGMPDAGKSSLLGAFNQAAQIQNRALQGRLVDVSLGLAELQRRLYEDRQQETREEIVPYPVVFEPYAGTAFGTARIDAVIYDCDGRVANELLSLKKALLPGGRSGALADAVFHADALILTIDASAPNEQVETDFREFVRFLKLFEAYRGHVRSVGGMPVYLVLSKCDLLARGTISRKEWEARIETRLHQVRERFARYLESNAGPAGTLLAFGSIELHAAATAVRRPALGETSAHPREPLGIAELFRDCLLSASRFRKRIDAANRQLRWIIGGVGGFIALAASVALMLITSGGPVEQPLALMQRIEMLQAREQPLPDRLAYNVLQKRYEELLALRNDPAFVNLPENQKQFVRSRIDELLAYQEFVERLTRIPLAERARSLKDLKEKVEDALASEGAVPIPYALDWEKTQAVLERQKRIDDARTLRAAVEELQNYFANLKRLADDLLFAKDFHALWKQQADAVFALEKNPPFARDAELRGAAWEFGVTKAAEKAWLPSRAKLTSMRELAAALGVFDDAKGALLEIPASLPDDDLHSFAKSRVDGLRQMYPDSEKWSLATLPETLQNELRKKLQRSYDRLVLHGQQMIRSQLRKGRANGDDTPRDWKEIADWLRSPSLANVRKLFGLMASLLGITPDDTVLATAAFLEKPSFEIQIKSLTLTLPNNLSREKFLSGEELVVYLRPQGGTASRVTLTLRIDRSATVEEVRERRYRYELAGKESPLTYKPLDEFGADLNLKGGDQVWRLIWSESRTATFAFESLNRQPLLLAPGATGRGTPAPGVTLKIDGTFPEVPALLPDVRTR